MKPRTPLLVHNGFCRLAVTAPPKLIRALDLEMAYLVTGHEMAPAFKKKYWDGREHLLKFSKKENCYLLPTGLLSDMMKSTLIEDFDVIDKRRLPGPSLPMEWIGHEPRQHQIDAINAVLADRGVVSGRGLLNLPIRSGKTLTAANIIQRTGYKTVFVVPSDLLLEQTVNEFKKALNPAPVGVAGGGVWNPRWITVATNQTLISDLARTRALLAGVDLLIVDEAHHLEAPAWRQPLLMCDAQMKIGLSATIFSNKDIPNEQSAIWLKAACGPILHRVSMKSLIDLGLLVPPHIVMYQVTEPSGKPFAKYSFGTVYKMLVEENFHRNQGIASLTQQGVDRGMRVLIDTGRTNQMRIIHDYIKARGVPVAMMHGKTLKTERRKQLARFRAGELKAIVGTVLGEGIDIPELEMVINAEGMKSKKAVIQRMRNLTPSEDKTSAIFIDFADMTHDTLREHSHERFKMYASIRGFKIHVGKVDGKAFILPTVGASRT